MSETPDAKLERMLRSRLVRPASPDLAQRIILRAQAIPQARSASPWQWICEICAEFHLPRPAYVLTGALVLGTVLGLSLPDGMGTVSDDGSASASMLLTADETFL